MVEDLQELKCDGRIMDATPLLAIPKIRERDSSRKKH